MSGPGTPLPWADFTAGIGEANGASIATLWRDGAERTANAAFIVRACNNHDALLEALQEAANTFELMALALREIDAERLAQPIAVAELLAKDTRAAIAAATDAGS